MQVIQRPQAAYFAHLAPKYLPEPFSKESAPADGTTELILYFKMGLVCMPEVQVWAAILIKNYLGHVVNDVILGFVYFGEDIIRGL